MTLICMRVTYERVLVHMRGFHLRVTNKRCKERVLVLSVPREEDHGWRGIQVQVGSAASVCNSAHWQQC